MEGEEAWIVVVAGAILVVVVGRATDDGRVVAAEVPVQILEATPDDVRMQEEHAAEFPLAEVWAVDGGRCGGG
jgi:hypothetical protein